MARNGMLGKHAYRKGKDMFRREEHIRIAPKHPGVGSR